jgi:ATP-binding cassette subfamily B protein
MGNKLTLKERIAITLRGYRILKNYCPGLAQGRALSALVNTLQPFASIWFSAQIINEISSQCKLDYIILYVVAVITINFSAALIKSILEKINKDKETQMWSFFGKIFSDKQMAMDYVDLENAKLQQQRNEAEENLYMFGNGLGQLVWGIAELVGAGVNILASIAMTVSLFTSNSNYGIINSPVWIAVIILCIAFGGICNNSAVVKENKVFEEWCKGTVWFNRAFTFFGWELYSSPERAKDLRIYKQEIIADRELLKLQTGDKSENRHIFKMSIYQAVASIIIGIMNVLCYLFVVIKAYYGAFGVGSIVQYVGTLGRLSYGVQGLMFILPDNEVYCSHLKKLYDYLDIPNKKYQGTLPIEKRAFCEEGDCDYEIEFCNVSFRYPGSDTYALHNVSLKFRIGERLAVVGQNGSGKTTFIKLLCRLYDPDEGEILLNGIDIRKYNYDEYKSIFSVVFQDFKLFSFPLGQNVAANMKYDKARVEACLKEAGFGERLRDMAEGVDTCLYKDFDEKGVDISGGEAQKIALARALYKSSPFIILDEPTAALDPIAEYEVYTKFNEMVANKTAIYISHRLSSCRFCDDIVVFDKGEIIQHGSHDQLVDDLSGKYHELWYAQAQYYN